MTASELMQMILDGAGRDAVLDALCDDGSLNDQLAKDTIEAIAGRLDASQAAMALLALAR